MTHYEYYVYASEWEKWRYAYLGGYPFIQRYLKKYSERESDTDFNTRKTMSYCPAFAKGAVNEVRNSIYERMNSVTRKSKSQSYLSAIDGLNGGVDYRGSTMNYFIGTKILPELLVMAKVAICIDNHKYDSNANLAETYRYHPYLYYYARDCILDWKYDDIGELQKIVLQDHCYDNNTHTTRERTYELIEKGVLVRVNDEEYILDLPKIPIVISEISNSLMEDIADYQIALLNLASSDIAYAHRSNFPLYVEQFNPMVDLIHQSKGLNPPDFTDSTTDLTKAESNKAQSLQVGTLKGRRFPKDLEYPQFISPPVETLQASMEKQEQLKREIRALVNLTLSNLTVARKSAESKQEDRTKEETGLSYIGLELQNTENKILEVWNLFEKHPQTSEELVVYPTNYTLKSSEEIIKESNELIDHAKQVDSETYHKEIAKIAVKSVLDNRVSTDTLIKIYSEIDKSKFVLSDPELIHEDVDRGLVSKETASTIRGYPDGEAEKAEKEHAARLAEIAKNQSKGPIANAGARGVPDLSADPNSDGKLEKQESRNRDKGQDKKKVRGEGK